MTRPARHILTGPWAPWAGAGGLSMLDRWPPSGRVAGWCSAFMRPEGVTAACAAPLEFKNYAFVRSVAHVSGSGYILPAFSASLQIGRPCFILLSAVVQFFFCVLKHAKRDEADMLHNETPKAKTCIRSSGRWQEFN